MVLLLEGIPEEIESSQRLNSKLVYNMTETAEIKIGLPFVTAYTWDSHPHHNRKHITESALSYMSQENH